MSVVHPKLVDPALIEPFNAVLEPQGVYLRLVARAEDEHLPCGGHPEECLAGLDPAREAAQACPHGWACRSEPIQVTGGVACHLAELRRPGAVGPDIFKAILGVLTDRAQSRYELQSTIEELVSKYELLSVLYDSAATIVSISNLEEVSHRILNEAADTLDVDHASLMLLDEDGDCLRVVAARGMRSDAVGKVLVRMGEGISGYVAREGRPVLIEDLAAHPMARRATRDEDRPGSLMSVPLKVQDRVLGVINVNNKRTGDPFRAGDMKLLMALADLAAISIENARTYQNAITDRLTRLYNYGYFKEQLAKLLSLAIGERKPLSLLMFDIDHFKNFNDVNGHELANVVLVGVASICVTNSRQKGDRMPDLVARYGGEEFIILLQDVAKEDAATTAERIRVLVESEAFQGREKQPGGRVTISLGVASYPEDARTADGLINAADEALYKAKRSGRNNVQLA